MITAAAAADMILAGALLLTTATAAAAQSPADAVAQMVVDSIPVEPLDEFDADWVLYGDKFELTDSSEHKNFKCECRLFYDSKLIDEFGTSAVSLGVLVEQGKLDAYCDIREREQACKLSDCRINTRWSLSHYLCTQHSRNTFQEVASCLRQSHAITDRACHGTCWQRVLKYEPSASEEQLGVVDSGTEVYDGAMFPVQPNAADIARECIYQDCYLTCQKAVLRSVCPKLHNATGVFLANLVGNRTRSENEQHRRPTECKRLMEHNRDVRQTDLLFFAAAGSSSDKGPQPDRLRMAELIEEQQQQQQQQQANAAGASRACWPMLLTLVIVCKWCDHLI